MKKNRKKENKTKWIIIGLVIAIVVGVIIYLLWKTPASLQDISIMEDTCIPTGSVRTIR